MKLIFQILFLVTFIIYSHQILINENQLPLSTRGRNIIDAQGREVRLSCVNCNL
jgi:hypothetical protein